MKRAREIDLEQQDEVNNINLQFSKDYEVALSEIVPEISKKQKICKKKSKWASHLANREIMTQVPDDLENWYIIKCPKGERCLLVSMNRILRAYRKDGSLLKEIETNYQQFFVLDCFYDTIFYVLDAMYWGDISLYNCDSVFRHYWMQTREFPNFVVPLEFKKILPGSNYEDGRYCVFHKEAHYYSGLHLSYWASGKEF